MLTTMQPIRILLISNTDDRLTGADRDWINLANALGPGEVRITWVGIAASGRLRSYLDPGVVERFLDLGFPSFNYLIQENAYSRRSAWLWTKILADHLLRLIGPVRHLLREVCPEEVDLIVSNTSAVTLGVPIAWLLGRPHVWMVKECLDSSVAACSTKVALISRLCDVVVATSEAVARPFTATVRVLPDGSNGRILRESASRRARHEVLAELGLPTDRPVVAQVGGITWWKGQHVTAEAFRMLSVTGTAPPCSLLFLGWGSPAYRKGLDVILSELPAACRRAVRFRVFEPDDFAYLNAADIVVQPSMLPDPLPNAVREAMLLGKPVIGSKSGGIPEMILDGETGFLLEPGSARELADKIRQLLEQPDLRRAVGERASAAAGARLDISVRKHEFLALFRELAGRRQVEPPVHV